MSVQDLINSLLNNPSQKISIRGNVKNIVGFAEFKTINLGDDGYFKITFDDHSFLFMIPSANELYYTDNPPTPFTSIADTEIGEKQNIVLNGKTYRLENANDYQYVIRLIKGDWHSIEGEVKFSDYVPEDGSKEILSLGWIVRTGERADVNPKEISFDEISLEK